MAIIASLMMSAALPWMTEFTAVRSAAFFALRFRLLRSGRYLRRPMMVET